MRFLPSLLLSCAVYVVVCGVGAPSVTITGVDGLTIVSHHRQQQHQLQQQEQEQEQTVITHADADIDADVDTDVSVSVSDVWGSRRQQGMQQFCRSWGPSITAALTQCAMADAQGMVLAKESAKQMGIDMYWLPLQEIAGCEVRKGVTFDGCPNFCIKSGAVDELATPHIHFADYIPFEEFKSTKDAAELGRVGTKDTAVLRLSLKDSCKADEKNYHFPEPKPAAQTLVQAGGKHEFDEQQVCTGDNIHRSGTVALWNKLFGAPQTAEVCTTKAKKKGLAPKGGWGKKGKQ